jgi:hypothetical protein
MSNYDPWRVIQDFADRTRLNLEFIEMHARKEKVFETTQLINSMLGLLVFPHRGFFDRIPDTSLSELEANGWPHISISSEITNLPADASSFRGLIRYLRNGIAHFNIEFTADESNNITGIKVWNHPNGDINKPKNWETQLSLDDLKLITHKFVELIEEGDSFGRKTQYV